MAILNPDHLFEQADRLAVRRSAGPPRQVDLRRAISAAYYGLFHYLLATAADEVVGVTGRATNLYALVYRSIDHRALRDLCTEVKKQQPTARYQTYVPTGGFGPDVQAFAGAVIELQEKRHAADYDPSSRIGTSDAIAAITAARRAIQFFQRASKARRKVFVTLLLFPPR